MRIFWFVIGSLIFVALGIVGYRYLRPIPVKVAVVKTGKAIEAVYASGTIEAKDRVTVKAKVAGTMASLHVQEGDTIEAGSLLATIDAPSLGFDVSKGQAELTAAQQRFSKKPQIALLKSQRRSLFADLVQAQSDWKRAKDLFQKEALTEQELERAKTKVANIQAQIDANGASQRDMNIGIATEFEKQQASVASLKAKADDASVYAPLSGVVLNRKVEQGETVSVNQELLRIGDVRHLWIEAQVGEEDIGRVRVGKKAIVRLYAFGQNTFVAHVTRIFPDANRELKSFEVDLELEKPIPGLLSGMTCEIDIVIQEKDRVLLIPADAVTKDFVWVAKDGRVQKRKVTIGIQDLKSVEVLQGISEGEHVLIGGFSELVKEGKRVKEIEVGN